MTTRQDKNSSTIFLCRASGEGSHGFRVCAVEADVHKFYGEMFGEDTAAYFLKSFRDPEAWANDGSAYHEDLYYATFDCWKVPPSELQSAPASSSLARGIPLPIRCEDTGMGLAFYNANGDEINPEAVVRALNESASPSAITHNESPAPAVTGPQGATPSGTPGDSPINAAPREITAEASSPVQGENGEVLQSEGTHTHPVPTREAQGGPAGAAPSSASPTTEFNELDWAKAEAVTWRRTAERLQEQLNAATSFRNGEAGV